MYFTQTYYIGKQNYEQYNIFLTKLKWIKKKIHSKSVIGTNGCDDVI